LIFLLAAVAFAQMGVPPRLANTDYPAHSGLLGAGIVPVSQVAKVFSSLIGKDYVVVEVAVYPVTGQSVDLQALDFALNDGSGARSYPATPEEAVWHGRKPVTSSASQGPHVVGEAGVLVGTHTDPYTGRQTHGVATYGGVGVDNRPLPPAAQPGPADDPYAIEGRLRRMAFPGGQTDRAVAGYLYFPKGSKRPKGGAYGLEYSQGSERKELVLALK
jgi:hypothetical protein